MIDFTDFEKKTKIVFKDKNLLKQAFVHRSSNLSNLSRVKT
jgi:dsRNA-specific ribonuclease